mgnify:CR=1 FL=1
MVVISLGIGDPDQPTPRHVVEALQEAGDILPSLDPGTLTDRPVVLVTHDAVDPRLFDLSSAGL